MMRLIAILMLLAASFALSAEMLAARSHARRIMVAGTGDLDFGRIQISHGGIPAQYTSISPAQFSVTGEKGSAVRLIVTPPPSDFRQRGFSVAVANRDCRYSVDGGLTWRAFASGELSQDTRFPPDQGPGNLSTIHVQIHGTATVMKIPGMRRGDCTASLRLTATYLDIADALVD